MVSKNAEIPDNSDAVLNMLPSNTYCKCFKCLGREIDQCTSFIYILHTDFLDFLSFSWTVSHWVLRESTLSSAQTD